MAFQTVFKREEVEGRKEGACAEGTELCLARRCAMVVACRVVYMGRVPGRARGGLWIKKCKGIARALTLTRYFRALAV